MRPVFNWEQVFDTIVDLARPDRRLWLVDFLLAPDDQRYLFFQHTQVDRLHQHAPAARIAILDQMLAMTGRYADWRTAGRHDVGWYAVLGNHGLLVAVHLDEVRRDRLHTFDHVNDLREGIASIEAINRHAVEVGPHDVKG